MIKVYSFICTCLCIFFFFSCDNTAPVILELHTTLILDYDINGNTQQRLSVFAEESTTVDRVKSLRINHSDTGLSWSIYSSLEKEYSSRFVIENRKWFGSGYLYPPKGEFFPEGRYQVVWTDLAGRQTDAFFTITAEEAENAGKKYASKEPPAVVTISNGNWSIAPTSSYFFVKLIMLFDNNNEIITIENNGDFPTSIASIKEKYFNASYMRFYLENITGTAGLLMSPVML